MWGEEGRQFQMVSATKAKGQCLQRREWAQYTISILKVSRQENNQNSNRWMKWSLSWISTVSFSKLPRTNVLWINLYLLGACHGIKLLWSYTYSLFFFQLLYKKLKKQSFLVNTPLLLKNNDSLRTLIFSVHLNGITHLYIFPSYTVLH